MIKARVFSKVATAWLVGVGIGELSAPSFFAIYTSLLVIAVLYLLWRDSKVIRCIMPICALLLLGAGYAVLRSHTTDFETIDFFNGTIQKVEGRISEPPDVRATHQKITVTDIYMQNEFKTGKLLLLAGNDKTFSLNDTI